MFIILNDDFVEQLAGLSFAQNEEGNWGYKPSGADSVLPFSCGGEYVGYYQFEGQVNFTPSEDFNWMIISINVGYIKPTESNGTITWTGNPNATIVNKDLTFISKHQGGVDVTKNGGTYSWYYQYKSNVVLLK